MTLEYPGWALAMIVTLILLASLPVPIGYIHYTWKNRRVPNSLSSEGGGQEMHRELYTKCGSAEQPDSGAHQRVPHEEDEAHPRTAFLPMGSEHYRLLPQQEDEDEDEEQDTGVWAQLKEGPCLMVNENKMWILGEPVSETLQERDGKVEGGQS